MDYKDWLDKNVFEQDRRSISAEMAWNAAIAHCAAVVAKKSAEVAAANTYRGRVNSAASFAVGILDDIVLQIKGE